MEQTPIIFNKLWSIFPKYEDILTETLIRLKNETSEIFLCTLKEPVCKRSVTLV